MQNGVKMGEGDGTVSLISLGAMCVEGWKRKRWNPAGIKITTIEVGCCHIFLSLNRVLLPPSPFSSPIAQFQQFRAVVLIQVTMSISSALQGSMKLFSR